MPTYEGRLNGAGLRVGIVVSRFNELVTKQLLEGAQHGLRRHGVSESDVHVAWVPGAFEIPLVARRLASSGALDVVICLGAVIRGETAHFEYVAGQASSGVARAALDADKPLVFGILTTDNLDQALDRAGSKLGNKGYEAAVAAIEMVDLLRQLPGSKSQVSSR